MTSSFVLTSPLLYNMHSIFNIFCHLYINFFSTRGEFKFDKFHGNGEITYTSGAIYKGDFENGEVSSFILYVLYAQRVSIPILAPPTVHRWPLGLNFIESQFILSLESAICMWSIESKAVNHFPSSDMNCHKLRTHLSVIRKCCASVISYGLHLKRQEAGFCI